MENQNLDADKFDFAAHAQAAVNEYLKVHPFWSDVAAAVGRVIDQALKSRDIQVHSVQFRAKEAASFGHKASKPSDDDPNRPKYPDPLQDITDLSGTRVITYFPRTVKAIDQMLREEFDILEVIDKSRDLVEEERFGYQSIHYLVRLSRPRSALPEYRRFSEAITEVQVRTILQHAWAEIEHDIQYKSSAAIPREIRRRFMALAGMLELADREFQSIQDEDAARDQEAKTLVEENKLENVEITPAALKLYLDRKLGADGRMSDFSYDWTVRLLKRLGFRTLGQINEAIDLYNDDAVSRLLSGNRQGQLTRFEYLLLASMREKFIERHPWAGTDWFGPRERQWLAKLSEAGIPAGNFDPLSARSDQASATGGA